MEKFNSTLISMLSKSVDKYRHDWDVHLPYLVFAYRVSCASIYWSLAFLFVVLSQTSTSNFRSTYSTTICLSVTSTIMEPLICLDAWALPHDNIVKQKGTTTAEQAEGEQPCNGAPSYIVQHQHRHRPASSGGHYFYHHTSTR